MFKEIAKSLNSAESTNISYRCVDGDKGIKIMCAGVSCIFEFIAYEFIGKDLYTPLAPAIAGIPKPAPLNRLSNTDPGILKDDAQDVSDNGLTPSNTDPAVQSDVTDRASPSNNRASPSNNVNRASLGNNAGTVEANGRTELALAKLKLTNNLSSVDCHLGTEI